MSNDNKKSDRDTTVREAAHVEAAQLNAETRAAVMASRKRGLQETAAPGQPACPGYQLQNVSDRQIDGILPGAIFDCSHWPKSKLDRVSESSAVRGKDLVILKPGEKGVAFAAPDFPELSKHKEAEALKMIEGESNEDKLRFWAAEDTRVGVGRAIQERMKALKV